MRWRELVNNTILTRRCRPDHIAGTVQKAVSRRECHGTSRQLFANGWLGTNTGSRLFGAAIRKPAKEIGTIAVAVNPGDDQQHAGI